MKQNNKNKLSSKKRLLQIISILKKHHLTKGIDPVKFRVILEDLGPTFVKIGQIMSSRQDMFSQRYCKELIKLRDNVAPLDIETVYNVIDNEYGCNLNEIFSYFDPVPLGSASIAQVHRATLKNGKDIVVKVQRPNIYETMEQDISLIRRAVKLLKINEALGSVVDLNIVLDEFWHTAKEEMDFLNEAKYARDFAHLNSDINCIATPFIETDFTTSKILVMEYIDGLQIDQTDLLIKNGYDCKEIAAKLAENYIKQIVDDGFFHADPHPGNLRIKDGKIIWIDFGMMGILNKEDKSLMKNAVIAIGNNDTQKLVDVILTLGNHDNRIDYTLFYNDIETFMHHYVSANLKDINLSDVIQEIFSIAHRHRISMPKGVSMLARGLVTIESTVMLVDPNISIIEIAANHVTKQLFTHFDLKKELSTTGKKTYEAFKNGIELPVQLSEMIKMVMKGRLKVNLDIMESSVPLKSINHMVNKLTVGIVSAGLLMASSLLCTTDMTPKVFGIPALGFIGYITAVGLGIWLLFTVIKEKKRNK